jgi:hypothetical protein
MRTILAALAVTVILAIVLMLAVLRAGIRQQEDAGSLTRRPHRLSAAITRRVCCLHARLPERAIALGAIRPIRSGGPGNGLSEHHLPDPVV